MLGDFLMACGNYHCMTDDFLMLGASDTCL